jgi:hypothetical protein
LEVEELGARLGEPWKGGMMFLGLFWSVVLESVQPIIARKPANVRRHITADRRRFIAVPFA